MKVGIQLLFLLLVIVSGLFALGLQVPCKQVITYRLGNIDPRFGLESKELERALRTAEAPWENLAQRELFRLTPDGGVVINFIYDERQERTEEEIKLDAAEARTNREQENIDTSYKTLQKDFEQRGGAYEQDVASYKSRLAEYNDEVERFNTDPDRKESEGARLRREAKDLSAEATTIEQKRLALNGLANRLNALAGKEQRIVEQYNSQVENFTERFAGEGVFDQGDYGGKELNIYQYKTGEDLNLVLAHELGHTLGIEHVENPQSLMYYLMGEQPTGGIILSQEDRGAFGQICSQPLDLYPTSIIETVRFVQQRISHTGAYE
jgi:hypothetical protein